MACNSFIQKHHELEYVEWCGSKSNYCLCGEWSSHLEKRVIINDKHLQYSFILYFYAPETVNIDIFVEHFNSIATIMIFIECISPLLNDGLIFFLIVTVYNSKLCQIRMRELSYTFELTLCWHSNFFCCIIHFSSGSFIFRFKFMIKCLECINLLILINNFSILFYFFVNSAELLEVSWDISLVTDVLKESTRSTCKCVLLYSIKFIKHLFGQ